jgi:hypothetical protein
LIIERLNPDYSTVKRRMTLTRCVRINRRLIPKALVERSIARERSVENGAATPELEWVAQVTLLRPGVFLAKRS